MNDNSLTTPAMETETLPEKSESVVNLVVDFTGVRRDLFVILIKNTIYGLLTLGIYRFWAKTHLRRYFWHNIRIAREPLEYTGLPSELFIGFLIAMAVIIPLGWGYDILSTVVPSLSENAWLYLDFIYYIVIFTLINFAVFRIWRYRLSRTLWRGVRFNIEGSAWRYASIAMLWTTLVFLTLGFAYPWMQVALYEYRFSRMSYGNQPFSFSAKAKSLILPWAVRIIIPVSILAVGAIASIGQFEEMAVFFMNEGIDPNNPEDSEELVNYIAEHPPIILACAFLLSVFTAMILGIWYSYRETKIIIGGLGFHEAEFSSHLEFRKILLIWFKALVLYLLIITVAVLLMFSSTAIFSLILGFLVILVFSNLVLVLVAQFELTRHFCETLTITSGAGLDEILQKETYSPNHGEGFADALDVGAL